MPRVAITGGPGAGKTTLLGELARLGFRTVPESARAVIAERLAQGLPPRPAPLEFAGETLRRDLDGLRELPDGDDFVFFDRSAVESLGWLHGLRPMSAGELARLLSGCRFHPIVFALPPWPAIFVNDGERDQSLAEAADVHAKCVHWYRSCGYTVCELPPATVQERARRLLHTLGLGATDAR